MPGSKLRATKIRRHAWPRSSGRGLAVACRNVRNSDTQALEKRHFSRSRLAGSRHQADEVHYVLLKILAANPNLSQRQIAVELGISVGKTNYCMKALVDKGLVKPQSLRNSADKLVFAYLLTPKGVRRKRQLAIRLFKQRRQEFQALEQEIEMLDTEVIDLMEDDSDGN